MDSEYYNREYEWCSNRLKVLNNDRLHNMNSVPPAVDKELIIDLVVLTHKQGLLEGAINNHSKSWTVFDHLLNLCDHPEVREQQEGYE